MHLGQSAREIDLTPRRKGMAVEGWRGSAHLFRIEDLVERSQECERRYTTLYSLQSVPESVGCFGNSLFVTFAALVQADRPQKACLLPLFHSRPGSYTHLLRPHRNKRFQHSADRHSILVRYPKSHHGVRRVSQPHHSRCEMLYRANLSQSIPRLDRRSG